MWIRTHNEGAENHIRECNETGYASHYTDGTLPALSSVWKVFEIPSTTVVEFNALQTALDIKEIQSPWSPTEMIIKVWTHSDGKTYQIKSGTNDFFMYDSQSDTIINRLPLFPENLETEVV